MFGRKEREYASCGFMDFEALADFAEELSFDELLSVNGGCGGGGGGGGGGSYSPSYSPSRSSFGSGSSSSSGCGGAGTSSSSSSSSGCGGRSSTSSSCGEGVRTTSSSSGCGSRTSTSSACGGSKGSSSGGCGGSSSASTCGGASSSASCGGSNTKGNGDNTNSNSDKDKESGTNNTYVENSNEGIANAKPGDKIIRKDGTEITLTQGDIDWAKSQIGNNSTPVETSSSDLKNEDTIVNTEPLKENPESPTDSGTENKEEKDVGVPNATDSVINDIKDTKNEILANMEKQDNAYNLETGYRCDNWVETVLEKSGKNPSDYLTAGDSSKTVAEHIDALKKSGGENYSTTIPVSEGVYVVFMGGENPNNPGTSFAEHCGILVVNSDGSMNVWHNSSANDNHGVDSWSTTSQRNGTKLSGFAYSEFYFQEIK